MGERAAGVRNSDLARLEQRTLLLSLVAVASVALTRETFCRLRFDEADR